MELGPLITLAVIYGIMSVIGKISEAAKGEVGKGKAGQRKRPKRTPVRTSPGTDVGNVRQRPRTFEDLLAEMKAEIERASRVEPPISNEPLPPEPVVTTRRLPEVQEEWDDDVDQWEDRRSSEIQRVPVSLETVHEREPVQIISLDEESKRIAAARRKAAEARNQSWKPSDHREFHQRIDALETAAADATAVRRRADLRRAMIWREVLDRPVALREGRSD